jgi:hypothetical protein
MLVLSLQTFRRNWLVVCVGVLITTVLGFTVSQLVPITYTASAQLVLLPPHSRSRSGTETGNPAARNPYLGLAGLQSTADLVARAMMDDETITMLGEAGVSSYIVQFDTLSAGPILRVDVEERSPQQAVSSLKVVLKAVPDTVSRLQASASVESDQFITARTIARPGKPVASAKSQLRAVAVVVVAGFVVTVLATSYIDAWRIRRRYRSAAAGSSDERPGEAGADDSPASAVPVTPAVPGQTQVRRDALSAPNVQAALRLAIMAQRQGAAASSPDTAEADTGHTAEADTGHTAEADTGHTAEADTGTAAEADTGHTAEADTGTAADEAHHDRLRALATALRQNNRRQGLAEASRDDGHGAA